MTRLPRGKMELIAFNGGSEYGDAWLRELFKGRFDWSGAPGFKGITQDVEKIIYNAGYLGLFETDGLVYVAKAVPSKYDMYGNPSDARIGTVGGTSEVNLVAKCLAVSKRMISQWDLEFELKLLDKMNKTLMKNVMQLGLPYIIFGDIGQELRMVDVKESLESDNWCIPAFGRITVEQLDLNVADLTASLSTAINATKARIMDMIGVESLGVTKESGVTRREASAASISDNVILNQELNKRLEFCDACKEFGVNMSVKINDLLKRKEDKELSQNDTQGNI